MAGGGGGEGVWAHCSPENFEIPKHENAIFVKNLRTKERVFIQENFTFNLSVTQSIPTSNEQLINYVLLHVSKFCVNL